MQRLERLHSNSYTFDLLVIPTKSKSNTQTLLSLNTNKLKVSTKVYTAHLLSNRETFMVDGLA